MSPLGGIVIVLFWLTLLALIVWLVRRLLPDISGKTTHAASESELEVLDRQLTSGDIEMHAWQDQRGAFLRRDHWPPRGDSSRGNFTEPSSETSQDPCLAG